MTHMHTNNTGSDWRTLIEDMEKIRDDSMEEHVALDITNHRILLSERRDLPPSVRARLYAELIALEETAVSIQTVNGGGI